MSAETMTANLGYIAICFIIVYYPVWIESLRFRWSTKNRSRRAMRLLSKDFWIQKCKVFVQKAQYVFEYLSELYSSICTDDNEHSDENTRNACSSNIFSSNEGMSYLPNSDISLPIVPSYTSNKKERNTVPLVNQEDRMGKGNEMKVKRKYWKSERLDVASRHQKMNISRIYPMSRPASGRKSELGSHDKLHPIENSNALQKFENSQRTVSTISQTSLRCICGLDLRYTSTKGDYEKHTSRRQLEIHSNQNKHATTAKECKESEDILDDVASPNETVFAASREKRDRNVRDFKKQRHSIKNATLLIKNEVNSGKAKPSQKLPNGNETPYLETNTFSERSLAKRDVNTSYRRTITRDRNIETSENETRRYDSQTKEQEDNFIHELKVTVVDESSMLNDENNGNIAAQMKSNIGDKGAILGEQNSEVVDEHTSYDSGHDIKNSHLNTVKGKTLRNTKIFPLKPEVGKSGSGRKRKRERESEISNEESSSTNSSCSGEERCDNLKYRLRKRPINPSTCNRLEIKNHKRPHKKQKKEQNEREKKHQPKGKYKSQKNISTNEEQDIQQLHKALQDFRNQKTWFLRKCCLKQHGNMEQANSLIEKENRSTCNNLKHSTRIKHKCELHSFQKIKSNRQDCGEHAACRQQQLQKAPGKAKNLGE